MRATGQAAVHRIEPDRAGTASALLNSAQQIGVAIGLALLAGIAATTTAGATDPTTAEALVTGYSSALTAAAGLLALAAAIAVITLRTDLISAQHTNGGLNPRSTDTQPAATSTT